MPAHCEYQWSILKRLIDNFSILQCDPESQKAAFVALIRKPPFHDILSHPVSVNYHLLQGNFQGQWLKPYYHLTLSHKYNHNSSVKILIRTQENPSMHFHSWQQKLK